MFTPNQLKFYGSVFTHATVNTVLPPITVGIESFGGCSISFSEFPPYTIVLLVAYLFDGLLNPGNLDNKNGVMIDIDLHGAADGSVNVLVNASTV